MAKIPDPKLGPRHVDVETMYNTERYRPNYDNKEGLPIFLTKADLSRWLNWFRKAPSSVSLDEIRRSFNEAAADEEHFPSTIDPRIFHVQLILRYFGDLQNGRVLDIGCGKGPFRACLERSESRSQGRCVSIWPKRCCASCPQRHRALLRVDDGAAVRRRVVRRRLRDRVARTRRGHRERAVAEMCRVVRPGGRIVIIDKNAEHWGRLKTPAWEKWFERRRTRKPASPALPGSVQRLHLLLGRRPPRRAVHRVEGRSVKLS